ncbi:MAG: hypothetical protein OXD46_14935, partial [Chloroflexi bacterium]|nr:hypothetical protein [Chloroflexota bacterium]
ERNTLRRQAPLLRESLKQAVSALDEAGTLIRSFLEAGYQGETPEYPAASEVIAVAKELSESEARPADIQECLDKV